MGVHDEKHSLPGSRGILCDIAEAAGSLCRIDEIIEEHGLARLIEVLDLGLLIYQAGDELLVPSAISGSTPRWRTGWLADDADDDEEGGIATAAVNQAVDIGKIETEPLEAA